MGKTYKIGHRNQFLTIDQIRELIIDKNYLKPNKEIIELIVGKKILDIGCNIGVTTHKIAQRNISSTIIGIDNADHLIEIADELYKDIPNLFFKIMDACELNFSDNEFDSVSFLEVIEHLNNPVKAIKEIYRVLRRGGTLFLSTNNVYYSRFIVRNLFENFAKRPPKLMVHDCTEKWNRHIFCWDLSTLYTLLNENGFAYKEHFYTGSSGLFIGKSRIDRIIDKFFSKIFPAFRATTVIKLRKL